MKHNYKLLLLALISITFICNQSKAQKEKFPSNLNKSTPLSKSDSIGLINLPKLSLPEEFKGPNAPLLPPIVDNSTNMYWRPVFAQQQYECGQASGIGLGFTYTMNRLRDLSSTSADNQYPPHFAFNWANGGNGYYGVSYFHSFEVLKQLGIPDVNTYGGMTIGTGDELGRIWMNGYDKYYEAMHNRLSEVYQIDVSTAEGIQTLKHWIDNYLEGSNVGGVANFYSNTPSAS